MLQPGRVVFSQMEEVRFGQPAAPAVAELASGAQRVFLMVSGTLNRRDRRDRQGAAERSATAASGCSTGCRRTRRAVR